MNSTPVVSIIIPIYNVEQNIERCARSLFEQTFKKMEFVFVNDCSPDNSIQILKKDVTRIGHAAIVVFLILLAAWIFFIYFKSRRKFKDG